MHGQNQSGGLPDEYEGASQDKTQGQGEAGVGEPTVRRCDRFDTLTYNNV